MVESTKLSSNGMDTSSGMTMSDASVISNGGLNLSPRAMTYQPHKNRDYLGVKSQSKLLQLFGSGKFGWATANLTHAIESVLFSDKVKKINMYEWNQERIFVITTEKVYNIKKTKIKRQIPLNLIGGLSKTT